jgi:cobyrinic acid a,c-diamide synthase
VMPERHLGLHLPHEAREDYVEHLATLLERHLDVDELLAASRIERRPPPPTIARAGAASVRIAVGRDEAFCFYYADNLELLEHAGAELVEFSPLRDPLPENVDGLYIGGGYPELHAAQLADNTAATGTIRDFVAAGGPVYGECGGLMYLARELEVDGVSFPMCGVLPFATRMPAPLELSNVEIHTTGGLFGAGHTARGHLYHHSAIVGRSAAAHSYELVTSGGERRAEGYQVGNVLASYAHLHFASQPALAHAFVGRCLSSGPGAAGSART